MRTRWDSFDYYGDGSVILMDEFATTDQGGVFVDYSLTTPFRFSTGAAVFFSSGFITADVEFTSPANAKYSNAAGISFSEENSVIEQAFQSVVNLRLGGEYRIKNYRIRAGFGTLGNPYSNENIDYSKQLLEYWCRYKEQESISGCCFISRTMIRCIFRTSSPADLQIRYR